ncbi:hypothetical protein [Winogradskyella aurantia]|uniref:Uncharacterized protein n=1 Tax=Winogradskyella aurantia TaxID=1915063 RepID=A0A265UNK5_9FLAO|nr:hypothetical protein [Winogradskyella aurantia]OZV66870.1 hypothetical protein CA834_13595 [Winogradskyella aurantia]
MKKIIILTVFLTTLSTFAQKSINNYKYLVVPLQWEFSNGKDAWRLNTLVRYLFKEEGFNVYFDEEKLPEDLFKDRCLALYVDVNKIEGGFLKNRMQISLLNCKGKEVMLSKVGESKKKDHKQAYNEAVREAFESFMGLNYRYEPMQKVNNEAGNVKTSNQVIQQEESIQTKSKLIQGANLTGSETRKAESKSQLSQSIVYYAQAIPEGYQVVNTVPEVVMILLKTSAENVFMVKGKTATVFKKDGKWIYSENDGKTTIEKELNIEF